MDEPTHRKYEVVVGVGRVVSRQRAHQMKFPERYAERLKAYRQSPKGAKKASETAKRWRDRFQAEHGMSYYKWHKLNQESK